MTAVDAASMTGELLQMLGRGLATRFLLTVWVGKLACQLFISLLPRCTLETNEDAQVQLERE